MLTTEEITALKESKPYIEGTTAIHQPREGKMLSQSKFTAARDLLLVRFATDNATRPGPLNNAKVSDYQKAESSDGNRVMLISKHKRVKDGPAILGMKPDLQNMMDIYFKKIRPQWAARDEDHLFVTVEGKRYLRERLEEGLDRSWKKPKFERAKNWHMST